MPTTRSNEWVKVLRALPHFIEGPDLTAAFTRLHDSLTLAQIHDVGLLMQSLVEETRVSLLTELGQGDAREPSVRHPVKDEGISYSNYTDRHLLHHIHWDSRARAEFERRGLREEDFPLAAIGYGIKEIGLIEGLEASGLTPIVIDEETDFSTLPPFASLFPHPSEFRSNEEYVAARHEMEVRLTFLEEKSQTPAGLTLKEIGEMNYLREMGNPNFRRTQ